MKFHAAVAAMIKRLIKNERGSIAVTVGFASIPLILSIGVAIDAGRAYIVRTRLSYALDAAGLAVGSSSGTQSQLQTLGQQFFNANFPAGGLAASNTFGVTVNGGTITVQGTATVNTTFMKLAGFNSLTVGAINTIKRNNLELAMVLDNTGSMFTNNNIAALRTSATTLVNTLFGNQATSTTLKIALVPYSAAVNPGPVAATLVGAGAAYDPVGKNGWKGCVVERPAPNTDADTPASTHLWTRYVWPPAVDNNYNPANLNTIITDPNQQNGMTGPNTGCPTPIQPLTNDKATILNQIAIMVPWSRGGTLSNVGMEWGLRVLSPGLPFNEGVAFNTPGVTKAAILMTDGNQQLFKLPGVAGPNNVNNAVLSDYSAYDRLDVQGLVGANTINNALTVFNNRLTAACNTMKGNNIVVYTITFTSVITAATKAIYANCATDATKYFDAPTQAQLSAAFTSIAASLSNLRVTQ